MSRTTPKARNPAPARTKTGSASGTRTGTESAPKSSGKPGLKPGPKPAGKPRPGPRPEAKAKAKPGPKAPRQAPADTGRTPVLQRRTALAALARGAVLGVAFVAMTGFAVALARLTLVPSPSSDALVHTNLRPGASIRAYLDQPALRDTVRQIGGNLLLGVPFGVLLPMLFPRARGLVRTAAVTALVMVLVETAQGALVEGRAFDIDDVILNTAGALAGYLLLGRRRGHALHPPRLTLWRRLSGFGRGGRPGRPSRPAGTGSRTAPVRPDRRPARRRP
jgi:hypothetical protein